MRAWSTPSHASPAKSSKRAASAGSGSTGSPNSAWKLGPPGPNAEARREGDVDLEPALEQKHAIEPGGGADVEVVDRALVTIDRLRPVPHDHVDVRAIVDTEEEVDVRPAVILAAADEPVSAAPVMRGSS